MCCWFLSQNRPFPVFAAESCTASKKDDWRWLWDKLLDARALDYRHNRADTIVVGPHAAVSRSCGHKQQHVKRNSLLDSTVRSAVSGKVEEPVPSDRSLKRGFPGGYEPKCESTHPSIHKQQHVKRNSLLEHRSCHKVLNLGLPCDMIVLWLRLAQWITEIKKKCLYNVHCINMYRTIWPA